VDVGSVTSATLRRSTDLAVLRDPQVIPTGHPAEASPVTAGAGASTRLLDLAAGETMDVDIGNAQAWASPPG
jgi:hypothetical protein